MRAGAHVLSDGGLCRAPLRGLRSSRGSSRCRGELEQALSLLFRRSVDVVCAGRTDAGVHARRQVVSFDVDRCELRDRTPLQPAALAERAHLRGALLYARWRQPRGSRPASMPSGASTSTSSPQGYAAGIHHPPPGTWARTWTSPPWNGAPCTSLSTTSGLLHGRLGRQQTDAATWRNFHRLRRILGETAPCRHRAGHAFLHSMVRTIVGTLVMVGRGQRRRRLGRRVLAARDRQAAGNAPACGLIFWSVGY